MPDSVDVDSWLKIQTWPDLRQLVNQVPTTPYVHPYGFVVFRLETEWFPDWHIRLHLWPARREMVRRLKEYGTADQLVHSHGWDIKSSVCLGSLSEHQYKLRTGNGCTKMLYRVVSDYGVGNSMLIAELDRVEPILISDTERGASDDVRFIRTGEYHSTMTAEGPAVSVVATSRTHIGNSQVVAPPTKDGKFFNTRRAVENADYLLDSYDQLYLDVNAGADRWAAFVFLVDNDNRVFVVRSPRRPELWQPIGGRSEQLDRDPLATVIREAKEEAGVQLDPSQLVKLRTQKRDVGEGMVHFWMLYVKPGLAINVSPAEILAWDWIPIVALANLPMYAGTRAVLEDLRQHVESCERPRY